jgi:hypothetical protein
MKIFSAVMCAGVLIFGAGNLSVALLSAETPPTQKPAIEKMPATALPGVLGAVCKTSNACKGSLICVNYSCSLPSAIGDRCDPEIGCAGELACVKSATTKTFFCRKLKVRPAFEKH